MWEIILYLTPATVALAVLALIVSVAAGAWWRARDPHRALAAMRALLAAWVALTLVATLSDLTATSEGHRIEWMPGQGAWEPSEQLGAGLHSEERAMIARLQVANVLLTLPLGALAALATPRWNLLRALGACWLLCCAVELVQALGGRVADVDDVLCNGVGAAAGTCLAHACLRLAPRRRASHRARRSPARTDS